MTTEKIEAFWEDATADDVARMMKGETVEARFRDHLQEDWSKTVWLLAGYDSTEENCWIDNTGCPWRYCQVYREPSWHANKPDPGPGYRLLEKLPDEELKPGDECFSSTGKWDESHKATIGGRQSYGIWYRRRLEPVEPEPKHYVLRVGDTVENPNGDCIKVVNPGFEQSHYALKVGDTISTPSGQTITITAKGFEVTE
jgi:hypothetical protein